MLLFREIYGWLRYLIAKDPLCDSQGIVVEEIYSTFAPFSDSNDGIRTLVIHKIQDGMTPRIEYRAIGLHPQIYWYPEGSSEGSLLNVSNQFGFPGDFKSWDCSNICQYLLMLAKDKLAGKPNDDKVTVTVTGFTKTIKDEAGKSSYKLVDEAVSQRILESIERSVDTGKITPLEQINGWLKKNVSTDFMDFVRSVIYWLGKGKHWASWLHLKAIVDAGYLDQSLLLNFLGPVAGKLPPEIASLVKEAMESSKTSSKKIISKFDEILKRFSQGEQITADLITDKIEYGISAINHFKSGSIPFQYLQKLEICDPYELVLPWSFIRRNVLSYRAFAQGSKLASTDTLTTLILSWLKDSHLLLLLYKGDPKQEDALSRALTAQIDHHISQTLGNDAWMKSLLGSLSSDNVTEMKKSLQIEFDLWLLDALSPTVKQWKLPLSPHSFSIEQKDQNTYNKMYLAWEKSVKEYLKIYRKESGQRLTDAISKFYGQIVSAWKTEELKNYKTKIPSASKILNAVEKGNLNDLLNVLCEDFENEIGDKIPEDIKTKLMSSPYFNAINREIRIQGMLD